MGACLEGTTRRGGTGYALSGGVEKSSKAGAGRQRWVEEGGKIALARDTLTGREKRARSGIVEEQTVEKIGLGEALEEEL